MLNSLILKAREKLIQSKRLKENKVIVADLLKSIRHKTLETLVEKIEILVKDLTIYHCDRPESYYAIHFERLDLSSINPELQCISIYIGLGLNLNMERTVLGFWMKKPSSNPYKFWLKVCQELKSSGISSIEMKEYNDQYWLTEAMNRVFN